VTQPRFLLDEHVRQHWGIVFVPGQTDAGLLVRTLRNIFEHYSAESFQNTVRFIQEFA
jgi:hypothetical protein